MLATTTTTATIAGIGVDLVPIFRIERALARHGDRFPLKVLGEQEWARFEAQRKRNVERSVRFLATRFAAKEAFAKAIGVGMHAPMQWSRLQTLNTSTGCPVLVLAQPLLTWYTLRFGAAHVSLTDERDMAVAYVVVESKREVTPTD